MTQREDDEKRQSPSSPPPPTPPQPPRRLPIWALVPLAAFLALAILAYSMLGRDQDALPSALMDKPVPQTELANLYPDGPPLTSALLEAPGVKLLNVWASWCGPCRVEHPELMKLKEMGVTLYGMDYKDDRTDALSFLRELGDPFDLVGADANGRAGIEWGVYGVPETFVIDGQGRIVGKHVGPIQNHDLERKILPMLREAGWEG